jgi:hypothetical protein
MKKLIILGTFCAISASAQISIGVLGGAPFTDVVNATNQNNISFVTNSSNFTVGPALQIGLPLGLRVEVDALYRPYSFIATSTVPPPFATSTAPVHVSASEWRFPLLAQYRFPFPVIRPFIEGGVSFNHLTNTSGTALITTGPGNFINSTNAGVVLGGGVDLKIPLVRLSAELRYTRLGNHYFQNISNVNQAEFLFGVHF